MKIYHIIAIRNRGCKQWQIRGALPEFVGSRNKRQNTACSKKKDEQKLKGKCCSSRQIHVGLVWKMIVVANSNCNAIQISLSREEGDYFFTSSSFKLFLKLTRSSHSRLRSIPKNLLHKPTSQTNSQNNSHDRKMSFRAHMIRIQPLGPMSHFKVIIAIVTKQKLK